MSSVRSAQLTNLGAIALRLSMWKPASPAAKNNDCIYPSESESVGRRCEGKDASSCWTIWIKAENACSGPDFRYLYTRPLEQDYGENGCEKCEWSLAVQTRGCRNNATCSVSAV